jgi:spore coat protein CotH
MTKINIIFENSPRWILSEPMAYELYRAAGIPACLTEHVRTWVDDHPIGYQLLIEGPNKSFLTRNERDDTGNMYKLRWTGHGLVGQHVKKNHFANGHTDLIALHTGLNQQSGAAQWDFIQKNFNVEEMVNYYAVNMCIQNWDGFFNNYWLYHDTGRTGKWEMYPWDEDKTWGDYDGASPKYDWYEMPLTFGMNGDQATAGNPLSRAFFGGGPFGGTSWWRPPGWFSGPLLANPQFRKAFLARLKEICNSVFTEEKMVPLINDMERHLEPEIPFRAQLTGEDSHQALRTFRNDIQSLRNQVTNRRKFILQEIPKDRASR